MNALILLKSLLTGYAIVVLTSFTTLKSIFTLLLVILLSIFYKEHKGKKDIWVILPSIIFGLFGVLTLFQVRIYEAELAGLNKLLLIVKAVSIFVGVYLLANSLIGIFFDYFSKEKKIKKSKLSGNLVLLISFVVLAALYFITWLNEYPGITSPDINSQISQNLSGIYVNHHPFLHTLYIKLLMSFGSDINESLAIATLIQLLLHAFVFALVNKKIFEISGRLILAFLSLAFYGLVSYHSYFSVTLLKDGSHAIVSIFMILSILRWTEKKNVFNSVLVVLSCIAFMLIRTNGYYAFLVMIVMTLIVLIIRKKKKLFLLLLISFVLATLIKGPLYSALGVKNASFAENLSIPLQQIAFTLNQGGQVNESQIALLSKIVDVNQMKDSYEYFLSDPIKNLVNEFGNIEYLNANKLAYLKLWIEIGIQNPILYLRAMVNQFSGFIEPNLYSTSIFYGVEANNLGIAAASKLFGTKAQEVIHSLSLSQYKIPLLSIFHFPAYYTWAMMVLFFYAIKRRNDTAVILISAFIGIWATLLISCPYNLSFRYFYAVVAATPLLMAVSLSNKYEK